MDTIMSSSNSRQLQAAAYLPRILVIEDDEDSSELLKIVLEMKGYSALIVEDGEECLALTQETPPDLIIMNVAYPLDKGLDMLRRIQALPLLRNVPIIVTSAYAVPAFQSEILQAGGKAFFTKPIDFDYLGNVIERHLNH